MIPSLNKQLARANSRHIRNVDFLDVSDQLSPTIPSMLKMSDARHAWPYFVPPLLPPPPPGLPEALAAAMLIKDLDRKLDPFPSGGGWYGNYTGPGNERSDWEDDHLSPQTPLDRGPMQHDQEYANLEERYGYGKYETGPDGKRHFKSDDNTFLTMRFDTENEFLHTSLIEADLRLMWRSAWYIGKGIGDGDYDLTFSKGPRGAQSLVTDLIVAGVILQVFPILIAMDFAFLGLTIGRHVLEGLGKMAFEGGKQLLPLLGENPGDWGRPINFQENFKYKPFPNATMSGMWTQVGGFRIGGEGYVLGDKRLPYEIGMRNTTMLDIYLTIAFWYAGGSSWEKVGQTAFKWVAHEWAVGNLPDDERRFREGADYHGRQFTGGAEYYGRQVSGGARYYGRQISGGADYYGRQIGGGAKYYGGQIRRSAKSAGKKVSDLSKQAGGSISAGAKSAGGKLSDAWKGAGGKISSGWKSATGGGSGGSGGGCFLTSACAEVLANDEAHYVLDTLRAFRDQILSSSAAGATLVKEYYSLAPQVVHQIDSSPDRDAEYRQIYRTIVLPTFRCVVAGRFTEALTIYRRGVHELMLKWCSNLNDLK